MRIVIASDSHGFNERLNDIVNHYPADLYLHCGDLEDNPILYPDWVFVQGNNDWIGKFAKQRVITVGEHKIFAIHSDRCSYFKREEHLARMASMHDCDIACYGHTHVSKVIIKDGVLCINPGSLALPRDGRDPSFAILDIDERGVHVEILFENDWKFIQDTQVIQYE